MGQVDYLEAATRCVLWRKTVLKNLAIFTGKHLCCSLSLKGGLKACNFVKMSSQHRCFPVSIAKFVRTSILNNTSEQLLLVINSSQSRLSYSQLNPFQSSVAFHIEPSHLMLFQSMWQKPLVGPLKREDIKGHCKVNFCISKLIIQCNTGGVNMYY